MYRLPLHWMAVSFLTEASEFYEVSLALMPVLLGSAQKVPSCICGFKTGPTFSLMRFRVSGPMLRSLIHLVLSFVQHERQDQLLFMYLSSLTRTIYWRCCFFFQCVFKMFFFHFVRKIAVVYIDNCVEFVRAFGWRAISTIPILPFHGHRELSAFWHLLQFLASTS